MANSLFYNKNSQYLAIVFILCLVTCSFSQQKTKTEFSKAEIETFAIEVFQHKNIQLILDTKSKRMQLITRFLNKQYAISYSPQYKGKKFKSLSEVKLNNKHNTSLQTDVNYNPKNFNPLKYKFPLHSKSDEMYRVGNTDYIITIQKLN
jgi:hypothetical protein